MCTTNKDDELRLICENLINMGELPNTALAGNSPKS